MANKPLVDQILDKWDEVREKNPRVSLNQFIEKRLKKIDPKLVESFRKKAEALAVIEPKIKQVMGSASTTNLDKVGKELRLSALQPGLKPIPGYTLVSRLGSGGFGEVWKAESPGGFHVALKFVQIERRAGAIEERSLEVIKDVRHPHLLSVFGTWRIDDWLIIASELADRTLLDRFDEARHEGHEGIPREELLVYLAEVAKGIDYLNDPGTSGRMRIQHGDIKPQNLLLCGGSVKVGDFGLARAVKFGVTQNSGSLTFGYAAPECFDGTTSSCSDQYSLAITYCHLRGGRLPFEGTHVQVMDGHRKKKPDLSMLPAKERPAVRKALSKRPKDRWPTCRDFVLALEKASAVAYGKHILAKAGRLIAGAGLLVCVSVAAIASVVYGLPALQNYANRGEESDRTHGLAAGGLVSRIEPSGNRTDGNHQSARTSVAIDSDRLIDATQRAEAQRTSIRDGVNQIMEGYPLNVMKFGLTGDLEADQDNTLAATVRGTLQLDAYRKMTSALREFAKEHAILQGYAHFPLEDSGTIVEFSESLEASALHALQSIMREEGEYATGYCFLILGVDLARSPSGLRQELHADWFLLPGSFSEPLMGNFRNSAGVSLRCDIVDSADRPIKTRLVRPTAHPLFPAVVANLPFFPASHWGRPTRIYLDYGHDRYREKVLVFLPTLLVPRDFKGSFADLDLAEVPHFDIPLTFDVHPTELGEGARFQINASMPNASP